MAFNDDLALISNRGSVTLPGGTGSKTYSRVATVANNETKRRYATTASTIPQETRVSHALTGGSGFKQRLRSMKRFDIKDLTADTSQSDGVVPSMSFYAVLDRPVQSNGKITDAMIKEAIGVVLDFFSISGNVDKFLNQET